MYNSISVGEYVATYAVSRGYFVNQTKLQRILDILYGSYLVGTGNRLVDEHPQAWPYGPVFPHARKRFEGLKQLNYSNIDDPKYNDIRNDKDLHTLLDATLKTFGSWSAKALSEWSHKEGSPWAIAFLGNNLEYGGTINDEAIKTYFTSIMNLPAHE